MRSADPRRKRSFLTATGQRVTRDIGYAILASEGFETTDEVVFAEPGDMILLGVRTIEGFGVLVDNVGHRLVAQTTIVDGELAFSQCAHAAGTPVCSPCPCCGSSSVNVATDKQNN